MTLELNIFSLSKNPSEHDDMIEAETEIEILGKIWILKWLQTWAFWGNIIPAQVWSIGGGKGKEKAKIKNDNMKVELKQLPKGLKYALL